MAFFCCASLVLVSWHACSWFMYVCMYGCMDEHGSCFLASGLVPQKKAEVSKEKKEEEEAAKKEEEAKKKKEDEEAAKTKVEEAKKKKEEEEAAKKKEEGVPEGKRGATTVGAAATLLAPATSDVTNVECIFARVWRVCAPHMSRRPKP
jgi:sRNA-binding protein